MGDGELVLELGGSGRSLASSLQKLGVELLPVRAARDAAVEHAPPHDPAANGPAADVGPSEPPAGPPSAAAPPPQPRPEWIEVPLEPRQTLMDLAQKYLGTSRRFKEIMELNGWSDRDARRLKVGTVVKIPKAEAK
jgi:nucleoid-associated protein YgaU